MVLTRVSKLRFGSFTARIFIISVLIKAPVYSEKWPEFVVEQLDYEVTILTLGAHVGGDDGVETYFDLFDYLIDKLLEAYGLG